MKILCIGFYGHGNAGDEAVARSIERYFCNPFVNVQLNFSTEMSPEDINRVNKDNPFYKKHNIISIHDLEYVKNPDIIIVGGGDLSPLYGMQQIYEAKKSKRVNMVARIGTSAKDDFLDIRDEGIEKLTKTAYKIFDYISVRDKASFETVRSIGVDAHLGADLAMDLIENKDVDIPTEPYSVLVAREVRQEDVNRQIKVAKSVYEQMSSGGGNVVITPFCEADCSFSERLIEECGVTDICEDRMVMAELWNDPEKLKYFISRSDYVVSVGRLHPLVFAIGSRVPCYAVTYPWITGYDKISAMMNHAKLTHRLSDWGDPIDEITTGVKKFMGDYKDDQQSINIRSGYLKSLMYESVCQVLNAMGAEHGLGIERGMKAGEFRPEDYDESYYFGVRLFWHPHFKLMVYYPSHGDWDGWKVVRDLILKNMKPKSLLDVGCGPGWFIRRMKKAGVKVQGIDLSKAAWQNSAPGMKDSIIVGTVEDVTNRRFDVLTSFDMMEHVYEEDIPGTVASLKQAAGKYIVFNICTRTDQEQDHTIVKGEPVPSDKEWMAVSGHVTIRDHDWWKERLEDDDWVSDEAMKEEWFKNERFSFPSWKKTNVIILKRRKAS